MLNASPFEDEDPVAVSERFNTLESRVAAMPRRLLNDEEARKLVREWKRYKHSIGEPLHVWLGWTVEELVRWETCGCLPE